MITMRDALRSRPASLLATFLLLIALTIAACSGGSDDAASQAGSPTAATIAEDPPAAPSSQPDDPAVEQAVLDQETSEESDADVPEYPAGQSPDAEPSSVENEGSGKVGPSVQAVVDPDDAAALREPASPRSPIDLGDTEHILIPADQAAGDEFGWSADTDGVRVISGSPFHDDQGTASGVAYIFIRDEDGNWAQEAELLPDDGEAGVWFGRWTAIDGDVAIVGAPGADFIGTDDDAGAAYVFERIGGEWQQTARLVADVPKGGHQFGWNVDLDGDTIIVSASNDGDGGGQRLYVFGRVDQQWTLEATLQPSDIRDDFFFAQDIGIAGDTVIAGAKGRDTMEGANSGAVYVFQRTADGWIESALLIPDDPFIFDLFGRSLAIASDPVAGDTIVVGAYLEDEAGPDAGSIYVFQRDPAAENGWRQDDKLTGASTGGMDWFGYEVDTDGRTIVVGAPHTDSPAPERVHSGRATVFQRVDDAWVQVAELTPSDIATAGPNADYGWAAAVRNDIVMVGAWLADTEVGVDAGRAYIYTLPASP